ncbi:MAG: hypothetical protein QW506_05555, partial [Thermoproteota archaeon]
LAIRYPDMKGICMRCKKEPIQEFHHLEGNPGNNKPSSIIALCGTCHNKAFWEITEEKLLENYLLLFSQRV